MLDCRDIEENHCEFWKTNGHCNETGKFPYVLERCEKTCGKCKLCPTEAPTTPPPCSTGAVLYSTKSKVYVSCKSMNQSRKLDRAFRVGFGHGSGRV